jgi:hypothetical protein
MVTKREEDQARLPGVENINFIKGNINLKIKSGTTNRQ